MASLKEIRLRIGSVETTRQITSVMKMTSAAKFQKVNLATAHFQRYSQHLTSMAAALLSQLEQPPRLSAIPDTQKGRRVVICIASQQGMCGAYNSNVCKETLQHIRTHCADALHSGNLEIFFVGQKTVAWFRDLPVIENHSLIKLLQGFPSKKSNRETLQPFIGAFLNGKILSVDVAYSVSAGSQAQPKVLRLLPFRPTLPPDSPPLHHGTLFEPDLATVTEKLLFDALHAKWHEMVMSAFKAEHETRMQAMGQATENADRLLEELHLDYNQIRQSNITNEILEIVNGAEAMNKR